MKRQISIQRFFICFTLLAILFISILLNAQDPKALLFQEADAARKKADAAEASIYSPTQYETGVEKYNEAEEGFKRSKNLEDLKKKIEMSRIYFLKAIETTNQFKTDFSNCVRARTDALAVESPVYRPEAWQEAESALNKAAKTLEDNNPSGAKSKAVKAEELYRKAELEAVKANYLDKTRQLIKEGKKSDVKKLAPETLARAEELADQAEKLLVENRYDTDEPRQLAQEARYLAELAKYITDEINTWDKEKISQENVIKNSHQPIQKIADVLDINARFHQGVDEPTQEIIHKIEHMQQTIASLEQDLSDRDEQITALTTQIQSMESQLGDLKDKEQSLAILMEQQKKLREKYQKIEKNFTTDEAQVLRSQDDVIIRLYGLSFPSGKATIQSEYFGLLSKVVDSFKEYPEASIVVEGHTDSRGSDASNEKLSQARADAVREYLLATANIEPHRVNAVGYGETRPIASNETNDGRRKNRRIDIVIQPQK